MKVKELHTADHSRRVMEYSKLIGQRMKLCEHEMELLKKSALLHDIGKLGIPDTILYKQSKLTDKEYTIIKSHSKIGAAILKSIKSFKDLVSTVYHHHERFDGKGYPKGLKGKSIPLHARIIAIADTFDAITSNRPYRGALSLNTALSEIERNKGTQFDSYIADIFIEILKESPYYFTQFREPEYYL